MSPFWKMKMYIRLARIEKPRFSDMFHLSYISRDTEFAGYMSSLTMCVADNDVATIGGKS